MIHSEFIEELSENIHLTKKKTTQYSNLLIDMIRRTIEKESVEISSFGRFSKDTQKNRITFNPDENFSKEINLK